jgi:hypothetical protein
VQWFKQLPMCRVLSKARRWVRFFPPLDYTANILVCMQTYAVYPIYKVPQQKQSDRFFLWVNTLLALCRAACRANRLSSSSLSPPHGPGPLGPTALRQALRSSARELCSSSSRPLRLNRFALSALSQPARRSHPGSPVPASCCRAVAMGSATTRGIRS